MIKPQPFSINIPQEKLDDLHRRLDNIKWADDFANDDWRYGTEQQYLRELMAYWRHDYDWRVAEARMNRHAHYRVVLDDIPIHFLHLRSAATDKPVIPLIMTHGWPWTFWDFEQLIDALNSNEGADIAFDLVVPSLPGYGFSSPLRTSGVGWARVAELWHRLMHDCLGYERYAVHGGDWGGIVSTEIAHRFPHHVIGLHTTLPGHPALGYGVQKKEDYSDAEQVFFQRMQEKQSIIASHYTVQSLDPQTLGYALQDSPLGLAAWIVERRRAWSDCKGDVEKCFSKDQLLDLISIYWFTETITSSMRFYWEHSRQSWTPAYNDTPAIKVPSAYARLPQEVIYLPEKLFRQNADLRQVTDFESGGHFAAAEVPGPLAEDIQRFFSKLV